MMKIGIIVMMAFVAVQGQRGSYAGRLKSEYPSFYPGVAEYVPYNQFPSAPYPANPPFTGSPSRNTQNPFARPSQNDNLKYIDNSVDIASRPSYETVPATTPAPVQPVDDIISRIGNLPRDQQPFWYINWKQIQEQIGGTQEVPTSSWVRGSYGG